MIDTHAHIFSNLFDPDFREMMTGASNAGITDIVVPAIDRNSWKSMRKLQSNCVRIWYTAGIHPTEVKYNIKEELRYLDAFLQEYFVTAIGETGLDFYRSVKYEKQQRDSFLWHCDLALEHNIPMICHVRHSEEEFLNGIGKKQNGSLKGVWHCFCGTLEQAKQAIDYGLMLGIGGILTYENSSLKDIVKQIPLSCLVLETDSPYLSPKPYRGKRNEPSYLYYVLQELVQQLDIEESEICRITSENARKLFNISQV